MSKIYTMYYKRLYIANISSLVILGRKKEVINLILQRLDSLKHNNLMVPIILYEKNRMLNDMTT